MRIREYYLERMLINEFSFEKMAERYVQYYERLCGEMYEQR